MAVLSAASDTYRYFSGIKCFLGLLECQSHIGTIGLVHINTRTKGVLRLGSQTNLLSKQREPP